MRFNSFVTICQSVNKTPINAQPYKKAGVIITWRGHIVVCPAELFVDEPGCIKVFSPEIKSEWFDTKVDITRNIGHGIVDPDAVLEIELAQNRRICVTFIWCVIANLGTEGNIQVFKPKVS